ncbi:MAG: radical SAM protein [Clostridiales bacterium]|nr:radical SAM protein [Clostridiales bacterium]
MIDRAWDAGRVADRLQLRAIQLGRPLTCTLELTYRCNFRCRMCYVRMTDEQAEAHGRLRTVEEWLDMARQLRDAGVLYIDLTGGECTLYPGFARLYDELSRMGFLISVMSNAGRYDESLKAMFKRMPPYAAVISLYGGSKEAYGAVTGDPDAYERVVDNICFFRSIGVPVSLNFTVIRDNVRDYPKVRALCDELGLGCTLTTDITPHRYGAHLSETAECRLTTAERVCVACSRPDDVEKALAEAPTLERLLDGFEPPLAPPENLPMPGNMCIGARTACAIAWNGDMQTCVSLLGYENVHPFDTGFEAAWAQLKARQAETFAAPAACALCDMAEECTHNCAGRRFEGTGSPHEPDRELCRYTYLFRRFGETHGDAIPSRAPDCT